MKAFQCDKCGEYFRRERGALQKAISFDGQRGPRTLSVDLIHCCVHSLGRELPMYHQVHFCADCLLWLLEEYKGSIMVAVGGSEENVTEDSAE